MNAIAAQWEMFERLVIPNVSPLQRNEMRKAFYCGAEAVLRICLNIGAMSEEGGVAVMKGLHEECHRFASETLSEAAQS